MRTRTLLTLCLAAIAVTAGGGCNANPRQTSAAAVGASEKPQRGLAMTTRERWRVAMPGAAVGFPAVDGDEIFITLPDAVVALNQAGEVKWSTPFAKTRVYGPRVDNDLVFVAGHNGAVALRRTTGEIVWRFDSGTTEADRVNRPALMSGVVVLTTTGGRVIGLDRTTGSVRWTTEMATEIAANTAVGDGVAVVVGVGEWAAFEAANGNRKWSGDLGLIGTSSPVVFTSDGGGRAAVASEEKLIVVNLFDGNLRWVAAADQSELAQIPIVVGDEILLPDHWGRLTVYRASDGAVRWKSAGPNGRSQFGEPVVLGDRLVAMPLDIDGPRLASPDGALALRPPSSGFGIARLADGGLVVSTIGDGQNYLMAYDLDLGG